MNMDDGDEFDMTDEQFEQYMAEGEPVELVEPPTHKPIYLDRGARAGIVMRRNRLSVSVVTVGDNTVGRP